MEEGKLLSMLRAVLREELGAREGLAAGPLVYSFASAAKHLEVSERTIRRMVSSGQLLTVEVGETPKVPRSELLRIAQPPTRAPLGARPEHGQRRPNRGEVRRLNAKSKARHANEVAKAAALVEARRQRRQR